MNTKNLGTNSKLIHAGHTSDATGSVNMPIYQTSTFAFRDAAHGAALFAGAEDGYIYTRIGNSTIGALEKAVAALEGGWQGVATSSGMGAVCTVYLALLNAGDHIVSTASVYGPSRGLMEREFSRFGVTSTYIDTCDLKQVGQAMRPNTKLVYVETPANPTMQVTDIAAVAKIAHDHGCLVVVDNTLASPYLQKPLELGADVVLHSVTKFINGHADVVGGILVANDADIHQRLRDDWTFPIVLEWTPCNYGGTRPWFLCPAEGCGRRVAIVYLDGIFACRKCYDLRYVTQRVPAHYRRIFRAQAIRTRLGGSPNLSLPRLTNRRECIGIPTIVSARRLMSARRGLGQAGYGSGCR